MKEVRNLHEINFKMCSRKVIEGEGDEWDSHSIIIPMQEQ